MSQLCSLLLSYATFRDTILYSRDILTLNEVYQALFSKEKLKQLIVGPEAQRDSLFLHDRSQEKNSSKKYWKRSKSKNSNKIFNYCK